MSEENKKCTAQYDEHQNDKHDLFVFFSINANLWEIVVTKVYELQNIEYLLQGKTQKSRDESVFLPF